MTRINATIPPSSLCDQHLLAEYRELPRVFTLAQHWDGQSKLPAKFTLGAGHVKFFYNKLFFLAERHRQIVDELFKRNYTVNFPKTPLPSARLLGDYKPTPEAHAILCVRLKERLNSMQKITYYGKQISTSEAFNKISHKELYEGAAS